MLKTNTFVFLSLSLLFPFTGFTKEEPTLPWYADAVSPVTEAPVILMSGTLLSAMAFAGNHTLTRHLEGEVARKKPLGSFSKFGDLAGQMIPNGVYAGYQYFFEGSPGFERSRTMVKASLYAVSLSTVMKFAFQEKRPNGGNYSFPSGHTTAAFAFASVVGEYHELPYAVFAYALAALTAVSRVNDNRHYIHDVIAGATIGLAYGIGVSSLDKKFRNKNQTPVLTFFPILVPEGAGLGATFKLGSNQ